MIFARLFFANGDFKRFLQTAEQTTGREAKQIFSCPLYPLNFGRLS
jgi:hypothetical protein